MPLTRRLILQKARHHPTHRGALTDCKHTVSGTISLPSRGTFHPSLTVLTTLSVTPSIQAYRVVPADSQQIPRARCYSGNTHTPQPHVFRYRTVTVYGRRFHTTSPNTQSRVPASGSQPDTRIPQPPTRNPYQVSSTHRV